MLLLAKSFPFYTTSSLFPLSSTSFKADREARVRKRKKKKDFANPV